MISIATQKCHISLFDGPCPNTAPGHGRKEHLHVMLETGAYVELLWCHLPDNSGKCTQKNKTGSWFDLDIISSKYQQPLWVTALPVTSLTAIAKWFNAVKFQNKLKHLRKFPKYIYMKVKFILIIKRKIVDTFIHKNSNKLQNWIKLMRKQWDQ